MKDAVNVCLRNLQDLQLAIAIARVVEQDEDGPILKEILNSTVLPTAFREGNRWLASWAFWMLRRRDIAVRVLLVSILLHALYGGMRVSLHLTESTTRPGKFVVHRCHRDRRTTV